MRLYKSRIFSRLSAMLILLMAGWAPQALAETFLYDDMGTLLMEGEATETGMQPLNQLATPDGMINMEFSKGSGSNDPAYYASDNTVRTYANNTFTVYGGDRLNRIVFTSSRIDALTASCGTVTVENDIATWVAPYDEYIYDVTFFVTPTEGGVRNPQARIKTIEVSMGDGEEPGPSGDPVTYTGYFSVASGASLDYSEVIIYDMSTNQQLAVTSLEEYGDDPANSGKYLYRFSADVTGRVYSPYIGFVDMMWGQVISYLEYVENGVYTVEGFSHIYGEKAPVNIAAPVISVRTCTFYEMFTVTLTPGDSNTAQIYYTLDGTEPDARNGILYNGSAITIPEGADVTLKAVGVNSDGEAGKVATAVYTYEKTYPFTINVNKPSGGNIYFYAGSIYENFYGVSQKTFRVPEGSSVSMDIYSNSGYTPGTIRIGDTDYTGQRYITYTMPASEVVMDIEYVYDPTSPGDPDPTTKKYTLTVVSNPVGAYQTQVWEDCEPGSSIELWADVNSNYRFVSFTRDGELLQPVSGESSYYRIEMPANDVVIVRNCVYMPANPSDPQQPKLTHPLTAISSPAGAATFSKTGDAVENGATYNVYAYLNTGYTLKGWILNGKVMEEWGASTSVSGTMTEQGASLVALCVYNPSGPSNPGANSYNSVTGHMVIDDFTPGRLSTAVSQALDGAGYDGVASLIVKGKVTSGDFDVIRNFSTLQSVDLSRTAGINTIAASTFSGLPLTSVILPAGITSVNASAFRNCANLVSLSVHAATPPAVSAFSQFAPGNCVLRVPEESIELYRNAEVWKDFADIVPLGDAVHVLEVQLPHAYWDGRLRNNRIDLVNMATGRRQRYVITERPVYTFNGVQKDDEYLVLMISESGLEMSRIENVIIPDADHAVAFTTVKEMVPVSASVLSPEGEDVTGMCTVEWFQVAKDNSRTYLRKGAELGTVPQGEVVVAKVTMNRELALRYQNLEEVQAEVAPGMEPLAITLAPLRATVIAGKVADEDGAPLSGASVNVSQRIAGKYDKSAVARVDKNGEWTATIVDAPLTVVTYSAPECVNLTDTVVADMTLPVFNLGEVRMRSNVGARIRVALTWTEAVLRGEPQVKQDRYANTDNISFKVYNETRKRQHPVSFQYPVLLVLDQDIEATDMLTVTATSLNGDFLPVEATVMAGEDFRPEVTLDLVGKGGVKASYGSTDSPQVAGILFNADGKFVKRSVFSGNALTLQGVDEGDYTLVAMTRSDILNAAASLPALAELGLQDGKEYVSAPVHVSQGLITAVDFKTVPTVDESLYSYTGTATSLTPNKSSVTSGQYLTIRSLIDFKNIYKSRISNVRMEFTIPEGCEFVDGSMMKGSSKFGYDIDGDKVVVTFGTNYSEQLRFCVIPTRAGEIGVTGRVVFTLDGQNVSQPVGTATSLARDFDFILPGRTSYAEITATGTAPANSKVRVMQDGTLIGEGTATQGGSWTVDCALTDTYAQKECQLQALITTPEGIELVSGVRTVIFDGNAIMIDRVTMLTGSEEVVFDFNHRNNTQSYTWVDDRLFTFIVKLTENAPEKVSDVILYVQQLDGSVKNFHCYYSESRDAWLCVGNFTADTAPVNVAVSVITADGLVFDRGRINTLTSRLDSDVREIEDILSEMEAGKAETEASVAEADKVIEVLDTVSSGMADLSGDELAESIAEVLAAYGSERQDYDESLIGDEQEIDRLIKETLSLLAPTESVDFAEMESALDSAEEYLGSESVIADDFEFDTTGSGASFETESGDMVYEEIPYSEINLADYTDDQISELALNDGTKLAVIVTDAVIIIADETNGKAWRVSIDAKTARMLRAKGNFKQRMEACIEKIQEVYDNASTIFDALFGSISDAVEKLQEIEKTLQANKGVLEAKKIATQSQLEEVDMQLLRLRMQTSNGGYKQFELTAQIKQLEAKSKALIEEQRQVEKLLNRVRKSLGTNTAKICIAKAVLDKVATVSGILWKLYKAIDWARTGMADHDRWESFIDSILPCEDDFSRASILVGDASDYSSILDEKYGSASSLAASSSALSAAMAAVSTLSGPNVVATVVIKALSAIGEIVSEYIYDVGKDLYEEARNSSRSWLNSCIKRRNQLKCHQDPDPDDPFKDPIDELPGDPEGTNRIPAGNDAEKRVAIDPAGYVYEGVHSNRVEGVQATAYYREEVEDIYGDKHMNVVLWDAEEYAQQNPLFTDADGMYAWDVPPGEWQVKFEKDGYNTSYSEWLPVPPPQLEVNVEITQNSQPEVKEVHAYAEGVDISFDKYMDPATLTVSNIFVTANGDKLTGTVEPLDLESVDVTGENAEARMLASKVRFVPEQPLSVTTGKVRLTISREVLSYAGIPMTENYTQELDVEKEVKEITLGDDLVKVLYGGEKNVTVSVLPAEAGKGRTVTISNSSPLVTTPSETEVTLDANGQADFILTGDLPGSAELTFAISGSEKTGKTEIKVLTELVEAEKPTASRPDGSVLYRQQKVELKSDSKGAVIYFTTDGTDPADADGTRRKYGVPLVVDGDMTVNAVAVVEGETSETSGFNYTVKRSAVDFRPESGWNWISHNFEQPVAPSAIATDNVKAILSQTDEVVMDDKLGLIGTLTSLDATHSYKVQAEGTASPLRVEDYAWNPATPVEVVAGWNWLGYPVDQEMTVAEAFAGCEFNAEDIIVSQDGSSQFDGENWIGTLTTLKPGAGYMLQVKDDMELAYNDGIVSDARSRFAAGIPYKAPWAADKRKYAKAMVVVAEVYDKRGVKADNDEWYVGAFSGTECRGVGRWVNGMVMMNVFGNNGDELKLRLINAETEKEVEANETMNFSETVVGSVVRPYRININENNGVDSTGSTTAQVVIRDGQLVAAACDLLEIFDTAGVKVLSIADYDGSAVSLDGLMTGVHVVALRDGDNYSYARIMVK